MGSTKSCELLGALQGRNRQSSHCQQKEQLRLRLLSTVTMGKGDPVATEQRDYGSAHGDRGWADSDIAGQIVRLESRIDTRQQPSP